MPTVILHCVDDLLTRAGRKTSIHDVSSTADGWAHVKALAARLLGAADGTEIVLCLNGHPVESGDAPDLEEGDVVLAAIAPKGDPTTLAIGLLASVALSFASNALAPKPNLSRALSTSDDAQRTYSIARFSATPVAGDARPVVLGRIVRHGGKEIFALPVSSPDGSGSDSLKILIEVSAGPIAAIGSITTQSPAGVTRVRAETLSGIYLDDQPIARFTGVLVSARLGVPNQRAIPGFEDIERLRDVGAGGTILRNTSGSPRTGSTASAEAFTFTTGPVHHATPRVELPQGLYSTGGSGQIEPRRVEYRARWRTSGSTPGTWSAWRVISVTQARQGAFTSAPRLDSIVDPAAVPAGLSMDIQLERVTPEGGDGADVLQWVQVVEALESAQTYPGRAIVALEIPLSEQVQSRPSVSIDTKGVRCRVWDGVSPLSSPVFIRAWTRNPFYHAIEYLTNAVWGMGLDDAQVDLARLVDLAERRAAPTVDRFPRPGVLSAGMRARYACDLVLDRQQRPEEWLRTILATADAVPIPTGSVWSALHEEPITLPVEHFADGDILAVDGVAQVEVRREWTGDGGERPNQIIIQLAAAVDDDGNPLADSRSDAIRYPDDGQLWLATEDPRPETVRLDGVTDRDQALAKAMLLARKARLLSRSTTITTTRPFVSALPGDLVTIACDVMGWGLSGRLTGEPTATSIRIDRDLEMATGGEYAIRVEYADGSAAIVPLAIQGGPTLIPAGTPVPLAAGSSLPSSPPIWATYTVGRVESVGKPHVVTSVSLADVEARTWRIEAREYDPRVFDTSGVVLPGVNYSELGSLTAPPGPMRTLVATDETIAGRRVLSLNWTQSPIDARRTATVRIYRRRPGGSVASGSGMSGESGSGGGGGAFAAGAWVLEPAVIDAAARRATLDQLSLADAAYEFVVVGVSAAGASLSPSDSRHPLARVAFGLGGPTPLPHTSLVAAVSGGNRVRLGWTPAEGLSRAQVSSCGFDHFSGTNTAGESIEHALPIARSEPGPASTSIGPLALPPNVAARFWVRSCDGPPETGRLSREYAWISVTPGVPPGRVVKNDTTLTTSSAGAVAVDLGANSALGGSQWILLGSSATGTVTFAAVDTGAATQAELTFLPGLVSRTGNPAMRDLDLMLPSLEADSWSVRRLTPFSAAMLLPTLPPWPDEAVRVIYEVRLNDGTAWGAWTPIAFGEAVSGLIRQWQMRATLSVANPDKPYRIGLRSIRVVLTH